MGSLYCLFGMLIFTNFLSQGHNNIDFSMTEQKIEHLAKWHCFYLYLTPCVSKELLESPLQNIQICRSVTFLRWESPEVHI